MHAPTSFAGTGAAVQRREGERGKPVTAGICFTIAAPVAFVPKRAAGPQNGSPVEDPPSSVRNLQS